MIEFLPDMQLKGQWRECALIAYGIEKNGTPNHLLVNRIMEYPLEHFLNYCKLVASEMERRDFRLTNESRNRIASLGTYREINKDAIFYGWHNIDYLRVCYANLFEKHHFGIGKSRITDDEWQRLCEGYEKITGEKYEI